MCGKKFKKKSYMWKHLKKNHLASFVPTQSSQHFRQGLQNPNPNPNESLNSVL